MQATDNNSKTEPIDKMDNNSKTESIDQMDNDSKTEHVDQVVNNSKTESIDQMDNSSKIELIDQMDNNSKKPIDQLDINSKTESIDQKDTSSKTELIDQLDNNSKKPIDQLDNNSKTESIDHKDTSSKTELIDQVDNNSKTESIDQLDKPIEDNLMTETPEETSPNNNTEDDPYACFFNRIIDTECIVEVYPGFLFQSKRNKRSESRKARLDARLQPSTPGEPQKESPKHQKKQRISPKHPKSTSQHDNKNSNDAKEDSEEEYLLNKLPTLTITNTNLKEETPKAKKDTSKREWNKENAYTDDYSSLSKLDDVQREILEKNAGVKCFANTFLSLYYKKDDKKTKKKL